MGKRGGAQRQSRESAKKPEPRFSQFPKAAVKDKEEKTQKKL